MTRRIIIMATGIEMAFARGTKRVGRLRGISED
jgi:hypothetical protein